MFFESFKVLEKNFPG